MSPACRLVSAAGLLPALVLPAASADWPTWGRDATRNAVSPEAGAPHDFRFPVPAADGRPATVGHGVAWAAELGSRTIGTPAVANGLVWIGTNTRPPADESIPSSAWDAGVLRCFREKDGAFVWSRRSPRLTAGYPQDLWGGALGSAPLVEGDRLWYVTNRCEVVCLDVAPLRAGKGEPRDVWTLDMRAKLGVYPHIPVMQGGGGAAVAGLGDRLYVVTHNGVDEGVFNIPAPDAPSLVCLEKATGRVVWTDKSPGKNIMRCQLSSPAVVTVGGRSQVVVGQGDGWLRGFDPNTGRVLWACDLNLKGAEFNFGGLDSKNYVVATPVVYAGRVYIATGQDPEAGSGDGGLYCVDPTKTGDVSRELADGPKKGRPNPNSAVVWYTPKAVPDSAPRIEVGKKKKLDLLRESRDFYFGRTIAGVVAHDGLVYAADFSGFVFCFDAATGRCHWVDDLKVSVWGQPLWADGKVYFGNDNAEVVVYAHGRERRRLATIESPYGIRAGLVFANGTLYVPTESTLYAIRGGK
ncbi:outer membrane protein assembly factor BamB family protein [Urbifossiella limnaea]|uniref:Outer membrane biogenesis protein BamB n=1 Tax=Urbifossiella limnaea TaxID=2528023 RepID=A0A517Y272_9BACT|nr:PQQ-binding-like beta-propeller repeat protein [Urbifossiella limnaea]QDU23870.1 outer membrane biogenesis protein BamB [Urbifossiella limnaea]